MDDRVPERVPAFEPPSDELAVPIATSTILGRGDDVVIVLAGAHVHSDGVEFLIDRCLRRGARDARQWHLTQMDFAGHWGMSLPGPDRLRFGLALGNGDVQLIELANAYRALANGGEWRPWTWRAGAPGGRPSGASRGGRRGGWPTGNTPPVRTFPGTRARTPAL